MRHGHARRGKMSSEYATWLAARNRCRNPNAEWYPDYGGRGIDMVPEWDDFTIFIRDMGRRPKGGELERIDNNGPYSPDNCRWATRKEQANNTTRSHHLTYNGITQTIAQWADELGISYTSLNNRIHRGWSIERALTTPVVPRK